MITRRSFLKLLGLTSTALVLPKVPELVIPERQKLWTLDQTMVPPKARGRVLLDGRVVGPIVEWDLMRELSQWSNLPKTTAHISGKWANAGGALALPTSEFVIELEGGGRKYVGSGIYVKDLTYVDNGNFEAGMIIRELRVVNGGS